MTGFRKLIATITPAVAVLATAGCAQQLNSQDAIGAGDPPVSCQPQYPTTEKGISSYYSVVMQLMNCQSKAVPLLVDLDLKAGSGTNLQSAGGVNAVGSGIQWDNGSGTPQAPATSVPAGDGQGGYGAMVGFTTVPYWNGKDGAAPGPYDAEQDPDNQNSLLPNFSGNWTVYSPSSMLQMSVYTSLPWPYTPDYVDSPPGALGTGVFLSRTQLGGGQIPIFTQSSGQGYGKSPADSSFVPSTCWDPLVLMNGADPDPAVPTATPQPSATDLGKPSDWSYLGFDSGPPPANWNFTAAGNDFAPVNQLFSAPVVMLNSADLSTDDGEYFKIPLRSTVNADRSTSAHYVKAYYRVMANQQCTGSTPNISDAVVIGGDLTGVNFAWLIAGDATFANSDLSGANLTGTSLFSSQGANLAFTDLSDSSGTPANLMGANFSGANLTGANLTNAQVDNMNLSGAKLLMTNLTGIDQSDWNQVMQANTEFCQTTVPGTSTPDNSDCDSLIRNQDIDWTKIDSAGCDPASCVFASVYNNSSVTLGQGFSQCLSGQARPDNGQQAPGFINPLDTAVLGWNLKAGQSPDTNNDVIDCGLTYANGANGKIQLRATSDGTTAKFAADGGFCVTGQNCLPKSADGKTPVVVDVSKSSTVTTGSFYNVVVCDASVATNGHCPTTAALPGLDPSLVKRK